MDIFCNRLSYTTNVKKEESVKTFVGPKGLSLRLLNITIIYFFVLNMKSFLTLTLF